MVSSVIDRFLSDNATGWSESNSVIVYSSVRRRRKGRLSKRAKGSERWVKPTAVAEVSFTESRARPSGVIQFYACESLFFRRWKDDYFLSGLQIDSFGSATTIRRWLRLANTERLH